MIPQLTWITKPEQRPGSPVGDSSSSELEMRGSFFRQQWETSGPGQLLSICKALRLDTPRPITIRLSVPGKAPAAAVIDEHNCRCDAMLHDVDPRLSETLRLTWVVAGCLVLQSRHETAGTRTENGDLATVSVSTELLAASLTLRSGLEIGVVHGDASELIGLANSLWGLQLDSAGFEWLVESFRTSPA